MKFTEAKLEQAVTELFEAEGTRRPEQKRPLYSIDYGNLSVFRIPHPD